MVVLGVGVGVVVLVVVVVVVVFLRLCEGVGSSKKLET